MSDSKKSNVNSTLQGLESASLSPQHQKALDKFIVFWGDMASSWGINRTMAQIYALLYAMETPLDTDEIMNRLQISRGNVSMNLRSLLKWKLIHKVHVSSSRRDYYTAEKNVWTITSRIIHEREQREIKPVREHLKETKQILLENGDRTDCSDLAEQERNFCERIDHLIELMYVFEGFSNALLPYIEAQNAPMIRKLIHFVQYLPSQATERDEEGT